MIVKCRHDAHGVSGIRSSQGDKGGAGQIIIRQFWMSQLVQLVSQLALLLLFPPSAHLATLARAKLGPSDALQRGGLATPVPYGVAIAAAALIVVFFPHFR